MPSPADHEQVDDATALAARSLGLLLALCATLPAPLFAQESPAEDEVVDPPAGEAPDARLRVAVLVLATGDLDPALGDNLTELVIGAVAARGGVRILGKEEFQAQLGQGEAATLDCISSMPCIGRIGVELGVREVIAGTLARRGSTWVFSLDRVDVASGRSRGRVFREVEGDLGAVADALSEAVPELYAPTPPEPPPVPPAPATATLVVNVPDGAEVTIDGAPIAGDGEIRRDDLAPGNHEVRVIAPDRLPWVRTVALTPGAEVHLEPRLAAATRTTESVHPAVWVAAGAAAGALAGAIVLGVASAQDLDLSRDARIDRGVTRAEAVAFYDAREREAVVANVLFGLAGAAAIAGVVALFFPERHTVDVEVEVDVALAPGGAAVRGRF